MQCQTYDAERKIDQVGETWLDWFVSYEFEKWKLSDPILIL